MDKRSVAILVAEDQASLQQLVEKQLRVLGYFAVDFADDGTTAVQKTINKRYHMIFMDVMMPKLDGALATEHIRRYEAEIGVHTPIIGMTGISDTARCFQSGMDDILRKPVMLNALKQTLSKWLTPTEDSRDDNPIVVDPGRARVDESSFRKTEEELDTIEKRINSLRKRFGLEQ